jgi:transposase
LLRDSQANRHEIEALGYEVRLMPPRYVKPYVKRNKNDMADSEAICEAVMRPTMRLVSIKTPDQLSVLMLHRTRHLFVRQRTMLINALRAHLAEFGIVAGVDTDRPAIDLTEISNRLVVGNQAACQPHHLHIAASFHHHLDEIADR